MYGAGIGTGATGAAALAGIALSSWILIAFAAIMLGIMAYTLIRQRGRRAAHQRP